MKGQIKLEKEGPARVLRASSNVFIKSNNLYTLQKYKTLFLQPLRYPVTIIYKLAAFINGFQAKQL